MQHLYTCLRISEARVISPPKEAKNSRSKFPHGQNSTVESRCNGLTFILAPQPSNCVPVREAKRQFVSPIKRSNASRNPRPKPTRQVRWPGNHATLLNKDSPGTRYFSDPLRFIQFPLSWVSQRKKIVMATNNSGLNSTFLQWRAKGKKGESKN